MPREPRERKQTVLFVGTVCFLCLAALISVGVGSTPLDLPGALRALMDGNLEDGGARILLYVRLPRTVAALLAGSALAVSGTLLQAVLNNALAGPNIIGVSAGAGFATLLCTALFPFLPGLLPVAAFIGALAAALIIYAVALSTGASRMTLVLAGVAISGILTAASNTVRLLSPDAAAGSTTFFIGGFSGVTLAGMGLVAPYILLGIVLAFLCAGALDLLTLGEETAASLGLRVGRTRFLLILLAALLAGAAVSFSGLISFVGLLVPHLCRSLFGARHRLLLPAAAATGGLLTCLCDTLARVLFSPYELPVGILLSFLGGPFFLYLLLRKKRGRVYA